MSNIDESGYLKLLNTIMETGDERKTRNSVTKSIFGERLIFNINDQFPLLTTKKMFIRGIFEELMWFIRGQTDSKNIRRKESKYLEGKYNT